MFWLGQLLALIGGLVGVGIGRHTLQKKWPRFSEMRLDVVAVTALVAVLDVSSVQHLVESRVAERLRGIALKYEFTPLTAQLRADVISRLRQAQAGVAARGISIEVTYETWVTESTRGFAAELVALLRESGFQIADPTFATAYLAQPAYPLRWGFSDDDAPAVRAVTDALGLIINSSAVRVPLPSGKARLHIGGRVAFARDGTVVIE
jgi:hypothetical protein